MFYSHELLSFRRKGKLTRCWLAATISEKMFKQKYKLSSIESINVSIVCEEILKAVEIRNGGTYGRFSLYLSSQLMYGAAKILFYQAKFLQDHLFEMHCTVFKLNSRKDEFTVGMTLQIPKVPSINEMLRHPETPTLHLIMEEPYTSITKNLMQDKMNFGILSTHEVEEFLLLGTEDPSLFRWNVSEEVPAEPVQIPLVDVNGFEDESVETEKETRVASVRRSQEESLIVTEDQQPRKTAPATPKKRTLKSPAETPTKKSKVSSKKGLESSPSLPPAPVPAEEVAPEVPEQVPAPVGALESELLQPLVLEDEEVVELRRQKKGKQRKLFDDENKLTDAEMRRGISNVRAQTRKQKSFTVTVPPANEYLMQPSVQNLGKRWGETLTKLFQRHLVKSVAAPDDLGELNFESEETIHRSVIRAEMQITESSKLRDQTAELSKDPIIAAETTDHFKAPAEKTLVEVPEIPVIVKESIETLDILDKHDSDERRLKSASKSSSSSCSKIYLAKRELLALLEIRWHDGRPVKFQDLLSPENYSKIDAACAFQYCLEFHTEKVVVLKQAGPFDTIWIEKYPHYTSESDTLAS